MGAKFPRWPFLLGAFSEAGKGAGDLSFPRGPRTPVQHPEQKGPWGPRIFLGPPGPNPQEAIWTPGCTDSALGPGPAPISRGSGGGLWPSHTTFQSLSFSICKMGVASPTPEEGPSDMEGGKGTSNTHEEEANAPIVPGPRARRDRGGVGRVIPVAICQAGP